MTARPAGSGGGAARPLAGGSSRVAGALPAPRSDGVLVTVPGPAACGRRVAAAERGSADGRDCRSPRLGVL